MKEYSCFYFNNNISNNRILYSNFSKINIKIKIKISSDSVNIGTKLSIYKII